MWISLKLYAFLHKLTPFCHFWYFWHYWAPLARFWAHLAASIWSHFVRYETGKNSRLSETIRKTIKVKWTVGAIRNTSLPTTATTPTRSSFCTGKKTNHLNSIIFVCLVNFPTKWEIQIHTRKSKSLIQHWTSILKFPRIQWESPSNFQYSKKCEERIALQAPQLQIDQ